MKNFELRAERPNKLYSHKNPLLNPNFLLIYESLMNHMISDHAASATEPKPTFRIHVPYCSLQALANHRLGTTDGKLYVRKKAVGKPSSFFWILARFAVTK